MNIYIYIYLDIYICTLSSACNRGVIDFAQGLSGFVCSNPFSMRTCSLYCSFFLRDPFHVRPCTESLNLSPKMMLKSNSAWDLCAKTSHELNEWPFSLRTCSLSYYRFLLRNPFRPGAAQKTPTSMSKDDVLFNIKCIISRIFQSYQVLYYVLFNYTV